MKNLTFRKGRSFYKGGLLRLLAEPLIIVWSFLISFLRWLFSSRNWKIILLKSSAIIGSLLVIYFLFLWITLPRIDDPKNLLISQSSVIVDRNGTELYRLFGEEDRTYIEDKHIPDSVKNVIIAIEDERYYDRGCLDIRAIGRAIFLLGKAGGGSTITRQLARNSLNLLNDNRYHRKIKEIVLGCQLENKYEKDMLLELYLNWISFGQNAYGIEQASQRYFSHSASGLTLAESSVLASLPQRPTYFSPYGKHVRTSVSDAVSQSIIDGSITEVSQIDGQDIRIGLLGGMVGTGSTTLYIGGRTDQVLQNMQNQEYITEAQKLSALEELRLIEFQPSRENIRAPHFVLWIREQAEELLANSASSDFFEHGGLQIETTLDWELQQIAEDVVAFHREDILDRHGANNIALLSVDQKTGEILSYVGNTDYNDTENGGKIDMMQAPRQPGSSFKPIVYAAAFLKGYNPATPIYDVPTKIGEDEPQNFDGKFNGLMTMRNALGASRNVPAAKAFFLGGGENTILALASSLGISSPHDLRDELSAQRADGFEYGWPLALGAAETPLYEMVQGYNTFARQGVYRPIIGIKRITDNHGNILYESDQTEEEVIDPRVAYQITSILSDEDARPEDYWRSQLTIPGYQTAAKTGTSNKCLERDEKTGFCTLLKPDNAWLIGYTPNLVTGVWAGNANSSALFDKAGGLNTASPIWRDYMIRAHRKLSGKTDPFPVPEGVVRPQVSLLSGQFPTSCTPVEFRRSDVFLQENAPTESDTACQQLIVDKVTRLLASEECPSNTRESGSFLVVTSLLPDRWPLWEEGVQEWADEQMDLWYAALDHSGAIIPLPRAPTEECSLSMTPGRTEQPEVSIIFPPDGGTATYPVFKPRIRYEVGSSVREVIYAIDGKTVESSTGDSMEVPLRVPRSIRESGLHTLQITLVDEYFNTVIDTVKFRFEEDNIPPAVQIVSPKKGEIVSEGSSIRIKAEARDQNGAIKYVQFYLDDVLLTTKPSDPFELEYKLEDISTGAHTIRVVAEDMAKNTTSEEVEIIVR
ncbi:hypothetical protein HN682_05140 [Candidatus Peregrinibacteria bacterium]|nr:hypothetical protein [Candidatus Peregrinibacteria bacterium]